MTASAGCYVPGTRCSTPRRHRSASRCSPREATALDPVLGGVAQDVRDDMGLFARGGDGS